MKTIRWGLIGCGDIALRRVGPALQTIDHCEIEAVSRKNASELQRCSQQLGAAKGYPDWRELVRSDRVDAVYIATPVFLHAEQVIAAAEAGKHVLCEKPMAITVGDCRRMIAACRRNRVQLGIAYYRHYYPVVAKMKTVIESGRIGEVMLAQIDAAETPLFIKDHPRYWIFEKNAAGGGCLMDFGCHRIEVLIYLLGPVKKATGVTGRLYPDHEVEDTATVAMVFESGANGVLTVLRGGTQERDAVFIQGTRGTITVNSLNEGRMTVATAEDSRQERIPPSENPHKPLIEAFCQALRGGRPVAVNGEVGLQVQEVISAVYQF